MVRRVNFSIVFQHFFLIIWKSDDVVVLPIMVIFWVVAQTLNINFFQILLGATLLLHIGRFGGASQKKFILCQKLSA